MWKKVIQEKDLAATLMSSMIFDITFFFLFWEDIWYHLLRCNGKILSKGDNIKGVTFKKWMWMKRKISKNRKYQGILFYCFKFFQEWMKKTKIFFLILCFQKSLLVVWEFVFKHSFFLSFLTPKKQALVFYFIFFTQSFITSN